MCAKSFEFGASAFVFNIAFGTLRRGELEQPYSVVALAQLQSNFAAVKIGLAHLVLLDVRVRIVCRSKNGLRVIRPRYRRITGAGQVVISIFSLARSNWLGTLLRLLTMSSHSAV